MDPTKNLSRVLELANRIMDSECYQDQRDGYELAELVIELHKWIRNKGSLPEQWRTNDKQR